ncbi:MAG: hypothetical protein FJ125_11395, partial [Deltaproteobacteria bacterium]|nr:hypothetical protein [Deltaproteobacteria bacterium]
MKAATARPAGPPWKIVLVVEDDSDGQALRKLATACGITATIDWLPANGIGNIKRSAAKLIRLALDRLPEGRGCVAVLVDRDGKDAARQEPHRSIRRACQAASVPYIEAVESFEGWCLADPGICGWLGLTPHATSDTVRDPKALVGAAYYRKTRRAYGPRRARPLLASHAD